MAVVDDPFLFDTALPLITSVGKKIWDWIMPDDKGPMLRKVVDSMV
jgi:hypothetical protein